MDNKTKYEETLKLLRNRINSINEPDTRREFLQVVNEDAKKTIADIEKYSHLNPISVDMMWGMALIGTEGMLEAVNDYLRQRTR